MADPAHVRRFERAVQALGEIGDPLKRLDAVRLSLEELAGLEAATVRSARESGATWKQIGALYGLSKQGAQQRFRGQTVPPSGEAAIGPGADTAPVDPANV